MVKVDWEETEEKVDEEGEVEKVEISSINQLVNKRYQELQELMGVTV